MPLVPIRFETAAFRAAPDVRRFLRVAYAALAHLEASGLAVGDQFGEWGSGLGVVTCLAAMAGFTAYGFEVQGRLVKAARRLAADFDLPAEFARGSFIPAAAKRGLLAGQQFAWLSRVGRCGHEALGMRIEEFDVIYAYPWPDEECLVEQLFEANARLGALLLTYHGEHGLRLRRKTLA